MPDRPRCIVTVRDLRAIEYCPPDGGGRVEARVRLVSDAAGLTQHGVKVREIPPGRAGTQLHFHDVEEEWAYVLAGHGRLMLGPHAIGVRPGHVAAFVPGPSPHHFVAEGDTPLVLLEGGERRPGEDTCTYPGLGVRCRNGVDEPLDVAGLPTLLGNPEHVIHIDDVPEQVRPHPLSPRAVRHMRPIGKALPLARQGISHVRLEPGIESTTYHTHDRIEEWVYVISGELDVRIGDDWLALAEGDFITHRAGSPAHLMRARTLATYLMGGQSLPDDICTYPERGMILGPNGFEKLGG